MTAVATGKEVSIEYTLKLEDDSVVASNVGSDPLVYKHGEHQIVPGLETALEGMHAGESKSVTVSPEASYGQVNPSAVREVEKEQVPPDALKVGALLQGREPDGSTIHARVTDIKDKTVVLDFNHPLAGKTLKFDVKVVDVREAPTA